LFSQGVRFKVVVCEGQPERDGYKTARALQVCVPPFLSTFFEPDEHLVEVVLHTTLNLDSKG
jgi:hypothetical protein